MDAGEEPPWVGLRRVSGECSEFMFQVKRTLPTTCHTRISALIKEMLTGQQCSDLETITVIGKRQFVLGQTGDTGNHGLY